jgi:1,4-dihydroxy-2-naphthoate octaprenyltransferase
LSLRWYGLLIALAVLVGLLLATRLGKARAAQGSVAIMVLTYVSIVVAVLLRAVTPWALLGLLTVPLTVQAVRTALRHYAESPRRAPANAATIQIHLLTGLLLCLAYLVERLV